MNRPLGIGVIGAGVISHAYLGTICRSPELQLVAIASRGMESARAQADRYGGVAKSAPDLLADPKVDIVVNLAPPAEHHQIGRAVLERGKHLYSEKPFATSLEDAKNLMELAAAKGLTIGCAPDTFLGPAHQAARRLIDDDVIGRVVGGAVVMASSGMEAWHPNPACFYARGGGPLLDIGPYMITQLVNLLGPVRSVTAIGSAPRATRGVTSPERAGEVIAVDVPTTVNGALLFESGANVALTLSWDVVKHQRSPIELYGLSGTLTAPTPNGFDGDLMVSDGGAFAITHAAAPSGPAPQVGDIVAAMEALKAGVDPMTGGSLGPKSPPLFGDRRGLGLIDMARAIRQGANPRASANLALHVLEVLLALEHCAEMGGSREIASSTARPEPLREPLP
ncbi:MAG: Gfo/Idh/MocA family oxidoreductase [Pseudomonadota bacterium]